jgi:hypothetical protein
MKLISEYAVNKLLFVQPSIWKMYHELKANDEVIGTIRQKGLFGMKWEITMGGKTWEIYRKSFWRSAMNVRESGYELPFAEVNKEGFRNKWLIILPKGERLQVIPHLFKGYSELKNELDECLVMIKPRVSFKERADISIEKKSNIVDKYPWSVVLAYMIIIQLKHQAAHAAAV